MDLNQVTLFSADVERAAKFYRTLGLELIVDSMPRYARFECTEGDSTLSIHELGESPVNNSVTLYFECKDVDLEYKRLKEKGIRFDSLPTDQSWLWREAGFRDPDGNRLVLFSAGENRKNPPWRVG